MSHRHRLLSLLAFLVGVLIYKNCDFHFTVAITGTTVLISDLKHEKNVSFKLSKNASLVLKTTAKCILPVKDPWDESIKHLIDPHYNKGCNPWEGVVTLLENGILNVTAKYKSEDCDARCLERTSEWNITFTEWEPMKSFKANCELVNVRCGKITDGSPEYEVVHTQIIERKDAPDYALHKDTDVIPDPPSDDEKPNVYIMVIDSVSSNQATRELSKTLRHLQYEHEAIEFPYLNKIGINSRPNGYAFLTGMHIHENGPSIYGPGRPFETFADEYIDGLPFVGFDFRDMGYHTLFASDHLGGVLEYATTNGFKRFWTKHSMKAYSEYADKTDHMWSKMASSCHYGVRKDMYNYFEQFLNAYSNQSQFAMIWDTLIAHSRSNSLYSADQYLMDLFQRNKNRFENSFVFFMADHGLRYGDMRLTSVGHLEDNNPFLTVMIPKKYRNSAVMQRLKENSHKLLSQYDVHATLVQIAEMSKKDDFSALASEESTPFKTTLGASLLETLPEPRHCGTLSIPFEFCLCELRYQAPIDPESETAVKLAQTALNDLHSMLQLHEALKICAKMTLIQEKTVAKKLNLDNDMEIYSLRITVLPSRGIFEASYHVSRENGGFRASLISPAFQRVNEYANQSACTTNTEITPICYCYENETV